MAKQNLQQSFGDDFAFEDLTGRMEELLHRHPWQDIRETPSYLIYPALVNESGQRQHSGEEAAAAEEGARRGLDRVQRTRAADQDRWRTSERNVTFEQPVIRPSTEVGEAAGSESRTGQAATQTSSVLDEQTGRRRSPTPSGRTRSSTPTDGGANSEGTQVKTVYSSDAGAPGSTSTPLNRDPRRRRTQQQSTGSVKAESGTEEMLDGNEQSTRSHDLSLVKLILDSYSDAVSKSSKEKYRVPPVAVPKFKAGGDWRCFLAEFRDLVMLADLKPSQQLLYLKQAVPEEAKKMLYQHKVETVERALDMLTELYEPEKDYWTAIQELQKITQQPGERLRVLAGRIRSATRPIKLPARELDELVKCRFKHALADAETRNLLLWEQKDVSLEEMIHKAQVFEDSRKGGSSRVKKTLRTTGGDTDLKTAKEEISKLKQKLTELQDQQKKRRPTCWNCGKKGHFSRNCKQEKIGDGFSFRQKKKQQDEKKTQVAETSSSLN